MRNVAPLRLAPLLGLSAALLSNPSSAQTTFDADLAAIGAARLNGDAFPEQTLQARGKLAHVARWWELRAEGRARWNQAYADTDRYSTEARDAYLHSADIRELYLGLHAWDYQLNLGWQQVVWGRADNLRVLDQVNPVNYREFVLPDLNDYRVAIPMARLSGQLASWSLEALFIPFFRKTNLPALRSEFYVPTMEALAASGFELLPERLPERSWAESEYGMHVARSFGSTDLSVVAFRTHERTPVFQVVPSASPDLLYALQPFYARQWQFGTGLAHAFDSGLVFRGEASFIPDFRYTALAEPSGEPVKAPTLRWLTGLDYQWRDWMLSLQATDRYIHGWRDDFLVKHHEIIGTFSVTGSTLSARLDTRFSVTALAQGGGRLWQLRNVYKATDSWSAALQFDVLEGPVDGLFGQFRSRSRVLVELKYRFGLEKS